MTTTANNSTQLSVDAMLKRASAETGLNDFSDEAFLEALNKLVDSYNNDVQLSEIGQAVVQAETHRILVNRLRFTDDLKKHPEILDEDVSDPIVVLGMPRTGTTKLQRILSAVPDVKSLHYWRLQNPAPFPNAIAGQEDPRIEAARQELAMTDQLMPDFQASHPIDLFEADEDIYLQLFSCKSVLISSRPVNSYREWLATESMDYTYDYTKQLLQYLQWQEGGRRGRPWVLKSPAHIGYTDTLRNYFPNASLIFTHRNLYTAVASLCRISQTTWTMYAGSFDMHDIGKKVRATFIADLKRHMALRASMAEQLNLLDVQYDDVRANGLAVVERVFQHAGRELTAEGRQAVLDWEAAHPQHAKGGVSYSLEDYGLTEEDIYSDCAAYIDQFGPW